VFPPKKIRSQIHGSKGKMNFLFLVPIILPMKRNTETLYRTYQELYTNHVQEIKLLGIPHILQDGKTLARNQNHRKKNKTNSVKTTVTFVY
jgi:hypothetical protein